MTDIGIKLRYKIFSQRFWIFSGSAFSVIFSHRPAFYFWVQSIIMATSRVKEMYGVCGTFAKDLIQFKNAILLHAINKFLGRHNNPRVCEKDQCKLTIVWKKLLFRPLFSIFSCYWDSTKRNIFSWNKVWMFSDRTVFFSQLKLFIYFCIHRVVGFLNASRRIFDNIIRIIQCAKFLLWKTLEDKKISK